MLKKSIFKYITGMFGEKAGSNTPVVYPQTEHGILRRLVSRNAIKVCETLQHEGFQAYIVGGAVRDLILGFQPKDFDVATDATPNQVRKLFRRAHIIGRRFRLVHVMFGSETIETSTFRAAELNQQHTDQHGRILNDNVFGDIQSDAARRDFTLNALYYDPIRQEVWDFHHGVPDLRNRVVRIIGDASKRYREDPVRMLRAVRFAAKLDATIEPQTQAPIQPLADLISNVPHSRLFDESFKLLTCGNAMNCLKQLRQLGLHKGVLPLLDLVLEVEGSRKLIELTLDRTDHRVRANQTVSPSFLYAAFLWPLVQQYHQRYMHEHNLHRMPALIEAADQVLSEHTKTLALQKRHSAEMREIWFMQPRFERLAPSFIWRLTEQPRFRAACDFLQIRAASDDFDSVLAQWWMDLANAGAAERKHMIQHLATQPIPQTSVKTEQSARARKRHRHRANRKRAAAARDNELE